MLVEKKIKKTKTINLIRKRLLLRNKNKVIISTLKMRLLQRFRQIGKVKKQEKITNRKNSKTKLQEQYKSNEKPS